MNTSRKSEGFGRQVEQDDLVTLKDHSSVKFIIEQDDQGVGSTMLVWKQPRGAKDMPTVDLDEIFPVDEPQWNESEDTLEASRTQTPVVLNRTAYSSERRTPFLNPNLGHSTSSLPPRGIRTSPPSMPPGHLPSDRVARGPNAPTASLVIDRAKLLSDRARNPTPLPAVALYAGMFGIFVVALSLGIGLVAAWHLYGPTTL